MKDQIEEVEVEDAEIVDEVEAEEVETEIDEEATEDETAGESEDGDVSDDDDSDEDESDAVNVVIGEVEDEEETPVIRTLRTKMRDAERKAKELQKKLDEKEAANKVTELGPKPTLADHDYDEEKFAISVLEWNEKKRAVEADKERQQKATEAFQSEWQEKHAAYKQRSKGIGIPDFEDTVEAQFRESFSANQQSILVDVCLKPELVMLALSQNEALADKLAGESNPVRYAAELVRLESKMKVSGMKPTTKPEKRPSGTKVASSANSQLEKLRAAAEKSGDYTAVTAYKRKLREK